MSNKSNYPWAELYDLESGKRSQRGQRSSPGRPATAIFKEQRSYMLSTEEINIIDELTFRINRSLAGRVTKSQIIGVAVRLLQEKAGNQVEEKTIIESWAEFAQKVFEDVDKPD